MHTYAVVPDAAAIRTRSHMLCHAGSTELWEAMNEVIAYTYFNTHTDK